MPTHPPIHRAGLRSREPGLCGANNTRPALSLATDLTLPLLCRAAVQELALLTYANFSPIEDGIKHVYKSAGIFQVTAYAENNLGSDTAVLFLHVVCK